MQIDNQRIRLAIDTSQMGSINDVLTGNSPQFWNGVDLQFELGLFRGSTLLDISNLSSITVDLKNADDVTGLPVMSATLGSGSFNNAITLDDWNTGNASDSHAIITFTNSEANLFIADSPQTFWLVISALTGDSPAHKIVLGATPLTVVEGGEGVTPPTFVATPIYYTAAQSDARYVQSIDLSTINSDIATLNTEMTAVTATANGALQRTGGTLSGALTITGLTGVLKATAGLVQGSATTSDLPEGSNLYFTNARADARITNSRGAASGICPLDGSSLVPVANLPANAFSHVFTVASQVAMLALSATQGDIAVRTDINQTFILSNNTPATLGNWVQILSPSSAVTSVNTQTGAVVLTTTNITEGTNLYYTSARAKADAIAALLVGFSSATGGTVSSGDSVLTAFGRLENRCALNDAKLTGSDRVKLDGSTPMTGTLTFSGTSFAGLQLNNLTDTQRAALTATDGMLIYNTTLSSLQFYNGTWLTLSTGSGAQWFNGSGAPSGAVGNNGDYYLNTDNDAVYQKSGGSWSAIWGGSVGLAGGVMTGLIQFATSVTDAIVFGSGTGQWKISYGSTTWNLEYNYTGTFVSAMSVLTGAGTGNGLPAVQLNGTQVLTERQTGWTTPTGTVYRGAWDPSTVTLSVLGEIVHALINDLGTHGIIGA